MKAHYYPEPVAPYFRVVGGIISAGVQQNDGKHMSQPRLGVSTEVTSEHWFVGEGYYTWLYSISHDYQKQAYTLWISNYVPLYYASYNSCPG